MTLLKDTDRLEWSGKRVRFVSPKPSGEPIAKITGVRWDGAVWLDWEDGRKPTIVSMSQIHRLEVV